MSIRAFDQQRQHPVAAVVARAHEDLDGVTEASVWSLPPRETRELLGELTRLQARVAEVTLRVAAHADRVGAGSASGATSTASWWAHTSRLSPGETHRAVRLARLLNGFHEPVRDALAVGELQLEQARVIVDAIEALPEDLVDVELARRAQAYLIGLARDHDARALRVLGRRVLDVLAPEVGEAQEQAQLEREERQAAAAARFTMAEDGHGKCHGRFTLPAWQGEILRKHLLALAAPKHQRAVGGEGGPQEPKPLPHRLGAAFGEWIESYPADRLPTAGGVSATIVVTMTAKALRSGLGVAQLDTGATISAGQARRLACEAGIIPAVLGGPSQVLDLGRTRRFHSTAQRVAIGLRDRGCTADGCDWPPGLCHVHHDPPWAKGGGTDVDHARMLCPHHHARAHDSGYDLTRHPDGTVSFHRRP